MEGQKKALLAQPATGKQAARLNISVVFTSVELTLAALKRAGELADSLGARLTLLVPQIVPYPLPVGSSPVLMDWNARRFSVLARQSPVETVVRICLCRDREEALQSALAARSLVVIGSRKRWWRTAEDRLARKLRRAGHDVILTETE